MFIFSESTSTVTLFLGTEKNHSVEEYSYIVLPSGLISLTVMVGWTIDQDIKNFTSYSFKLPAQNA